MAYTIRDVASREKLSSRRTHDEARRAAMALAVQQEQHAAGVEVVAPCGQVVGLARFTPATQ